MDVDYSAETTRTIHSLLEGPQHPEAEFIRGGATFAEVYGMAADIQAKLADISHREKIVCLAAENRAIIAAALLASLGGGPTLLLPYALSDKALQAARQAADFTIVITDSSRNFHDDLKTISPRTSANLARLTDFAVAPGAELLKIFTGGSTGAPQIWSKTAANIIGEGLFLVKAHNITRKDCILATIPPYHIYGLLFSVVVPLVSEAPVTLETPKYPGEIARTAEKQEATILVSVPAHYRALQDKKLPVRLAFSSAGMLDATVNKTFGELNTGIVEVYGSTETGGIASRNRAYGEEFFTPFPTIRWKIAEQRLAVSSPYISPELPVDNDGYFIANDRVEACDKNRFMLMGRADTITKVGGKRVDLDEISRLIQEVSGVSDCVVTTIPDPGGRENRICALIQGDKLDLSAINMKLADHLEAYALPRLIKPVSHIPTLINGKYDWAAIKELLGK
ncbi:MAG: class I adenylate-forming enzyme family protein [Desulfocapsaceae bacterium]|nr:class I adenylate-forming enzyme family protein [Desulfocapsaceae bacterium]